ncbi:MAG: YegS/Rv2252/BmrU family lipid kinase [Oscillospiraceae bacterium]|jgi:YegS/Rv2252/BmrU family lipid kinase|nr:YegS/Rv2252/BmrU family lipid kinase [Oscillospiraceae bacterium]
MSHFFDGKRALVVINPVSGKRTTQPHLFNITALFSTHGLETTVYTTRSAGDATDIVRKRGANYDIIVCRGGDGTFNEVVNGLMDLPNRPLLGYIPAGSTNDLARTLRIPVDSKEAIDTILNGQPLWNDIGCFNGGQYFAYTAACGAFTELAYDTPQKLKNRLGHAAYLSQAPRALRDIHPISMRMRTAEGYEAEGEYAWIGVNNSTSVAGILKLRRQDVGLNDGKFEVLLARRPYKATDWLKAANYAMLEKNYNNDIFTLLHTAHVEFEFDDLVPWTIDGEYGGAHDRVTVEVIHNAVQIFRR